MVTIVAFDIGVHHFAHAIIMASQTEWKVVHLDCHDFEKTKKLSDIQMDQAFWSRFHLYLDGLNSLLEQCDIFLIERQVGFAKMVNYKCIQMKAKNFESDFEFRFHWCIELGHLQKSRFQLSP